MTEEKLRALGHWSGATVFGARERAVLAYAEGMASTPVEVSDEVYGELEAHFDEVQIVELTSAIAWEHYRARFDHALGVEAAGFSEGQFCPLPSPPG